MKKQILLILLFLISLNTFSQSFQWAKCIGTSAHSNAIAVDKDGNNYTVGFLLEKGDFDPGTDTFFMTPFPGVQSSFICKLDVSGNFKWAKQFKVRKNATCQARHISTDKKGNIYVAGMFTDLVDFDPDSGINYLITSKSTQTPFISKLDSLGNLLWAKKLDYTASGQHNLDDFGNIYLKGSFRGTVDFDPGPGYYELKGSAGDGDAFIAKLNQSGNLVWAISCKGMNSRSWSVVGSIATDKFKNVYAYGSFGYENGSFGDSVDFNPGSGTFKMIASSGNLFVLKLDSSGKFIWAKQMGGTGIINHGALIPDDKGNFYLTGYFSSSSDFDPDTGKYYLKPILKKAYFILKLNMAANFIWVKSIDGDINVSAVILDKFNNLYITGGYIDSIDVDLSKGNYYLHSTTSYGDAFILKYDSSGKFIWVRNSFAGRSMGFDKYGYIYLTNIFSGTIDFNPGGGNLKLTYTGVDMATYISKLDTCTLLPYAGKIYGTPTLCAGSTASYSTDSVAGAKSYYWIFPKGTSAIKGQNTRNVEVILGNTSGNISVSAVNSCGYSNPILLAININPLPKLSFSVFSSNIICSGNYISITASGAQTYFWTGGIQNGIYFKPDSTFTYVVSGTDAKGCVNKDSIKIIVNPTPNFLSQPTSQKIANGSDAIFTVTNVSLKCNYQWQQNSGTGFVDLYDNGPFTGTNTKSLKIANVNTSQNNYAYRCIATEGICTTKSNTAKLTIGCGKIISEDPIYLTVNEGKVAVFETNSTNLKAAYQWQQNLGTGFKNLATFGQYYGTNTKILTIDKVALSQNNYSYRCIANDGVCLDTTIEVKLNVNCLVDITLQPENKIVKAGDNVQFKTESSNVSAIFQWQQKQGGQLINLSNAGPFSGTSSKTLSVQDIGLSLDNSEYRCLISSGKCIDSTNIVQLMIECPLTISKHPLNQSVNSGSTVKFGISSPLANNYQWQQNSGTGFINLSDFGQYSGVNTDSLTIKNISISQDNIGYRCIAYDGGCSDTSNTALLTVKTTDIKETKNQKMFSIFPNPANNFITIESNQTPTNLPYILTDQTGRLILRGELITKTSTIDISTLAQGFYFLQIGDMNLKVFKIVKQ